MEYKAIEKHNSEWVESKYNPYVHEIKKVNEGGTVIIKKFKFVSKTGLFLIVALFISGFNGVAVIYLQFLISNIVSNRESELIIRWTIAVAPALITPIFFYSFLLKENQPVSKLKSRLIIFNIIQYFFIQSVIMQFLMTYNSLTNDFSGMELILLSGWLALPVLILISLLFDKLRNARLETLNANALRDL